MADEPLPDVAAPLLDEESSDPKRRGAARRLREQAAGPGAWAALLRRLFADGPPATRELVLELARDDGVALEAQALVDELVLGEMSALHLHDHVAAREPAALARSFWVDGGAYREDGWLFQYGVLRGATGLEALACVPQYLVLRGDDAPDVPGARPPRSPEAARARGFATRRLRDATIVDLRPGGPWTVPIHSRWLPGTHLLDLEYVHQLTLEALRPLERAGTWSAPRLEERFVTPVVVTADGHSGEAELDYGVMIRSKGWCLRDLCWGVAELRVDPRAEPALAEWLRRANPGGIVEDGARLRVRRQGLDVRLDIQERVRSTPQGLHDLIPSRVTLARA